MTNKHHPRFEELWGLQEKNRKYKEEVQVQDDINTHLKSCLDNAVNIMKLCSDKLSSNHHLEADSIIKNAYLSKQVSYFSKMIPELEGALKEGERILSHLHAGGRYLSDQVASLTKIIEDDLLFEKEE